MRSDIFNNAVIVACLHDQNKNDSFGGPAKSSHSIFYPANQSNLKKFQKALIGCKKADPPKKPLLF